MIPAGGFASAQPFGRTVFPTIFARQR